VSASIKRPTDGGGTKNKKCAVRPRIFCVQVCSKKRFFYSVNVKLRGWRLLAVPLERRVRHDMECQLASIQDVDQQAKLKLREQLV